MAQYQFYSFASLLLYIIVIYKLVPLVIPKPHNGFSLELVHRGSLPSRLYVQNLSTSQRSIIPVKSSNLSESSELDIGTQGLTIKLAPDGVYAYFVKLQFGYPAIPLYLLLDTASDLVWTQCEPCTLKFRQRSPIYNSRASRTFFKLPCSHSFCRNNNSTFQCVNGVCTYSELYGNGALTKGVAASETLQPSGNSAPQHIYFGCSSYSRNFTPFEHTGMIGGIMGLSMSSVSLLQQLANVTQRRFSYCLPPYGNTTTSLRFGDDISTHGRTFKSTPIVSPPGEWDYFINLRDISVEGHRMNFPPNTFAIRQGGHSGGVFIDSGSGITRIINQAYGPLLRAFQAYFNSFRLERVHFPEVYHELCYKFRERMPKFASMTYHFEGADFEVQPNNLYWTPRGHQSFCLELQSSPSRTIIGATHQMNSRFIFDVAARQIHFAPENCEHDR